MKFTQLNKIQLRWKNSYENSNNIVEQNLMAKNSVNSGQSEYKRLECLRERETVTMS